MFDVRWFVQYDVELYQRIEHLIGKKLPLYKTEEEEVMCLQERVDEARRVAKMVSVQDLYLCVWILSVYKFCYPQHYNWLLLAAYSSLKQVQ